MYDDDLDSLISLISTRINKIFCDREFVGCVREDFEIVLKNDNYCVLFPKLKPIFLKVLRCEAFIFNLTVLCIGRGPNQVTVVCKKIIKEPTDECPSVSTKKDSKRMDSEENASKMVSKKSKIRPTQSFYVPPAQRSLTEKHKITENSTKEVKKSSIKEISKKSKDVLEAIQKEPLNSNGTFDEVTMCSECVYSSQVLDSSTSNCESDNVILFDEFDVIELPDTAIEHLVHNDDDKVFSACATVNNETPIIVQNLENTVKPDCICSDDSFTTENDTLEEKDKTIDASCNNILHNDERTTMEDIETIKIVAEASSSEDVIIHNIITSSEDTTKVESDISSEVTSDKIVSDQSQIETNFSDLYISYDNEMLKKKSIDCDTDNEKEEMKRALENINRKRRPLIKNIHNDNTLWINKTKVTPHRTQTQNEKNNAGKDTVRVISQEHTNLANWEDMFDDNGELHAEYIGEIVKQIGCEVKVVRASHDYSAYENTKYQDLEHVIELYDFPSTFKTQDIMQLYRDASENPMYVKWCDDTHCLLVLSTPAQAKRALQIEHDIIKSRPLGLASSIAATTASSSDLKPAMKRPQTNMQTARRLINTHLGTKSTLSKEEVEQERQALRDAREQRRLERQNEKDAWEGRPKNTKS